MKQQKSLYQAINDAGIKTNHHESDLYFPVTKQSTLILYRYPEAFKICSIFQSEIDEKPWYDIPFHFEPYWDKKNQSYEYKQIQQIINSVQSDSTYPAAIKIRHEETQTKSLNISLDQLIQIQKILS